MSEQNRDDDRFRKRNFHMFLFDAEYDMLEQKAAAAGKSKSDFLRDFIVNGEVKGRSEMPEAIRKVYAVLTDIDFQLRGAIYREEMKDDGAEAGEELVKLKDQVEALTNLYAEAFLELEDEA